MKRRFTYSAPKTREPLPGYPEHSGQDVDVIGKRTETDPAMYLIQARDGWTGHAYAYELAEIERAAPKPKPAPAEPRLF